MERIKEFLTNKKTIFSFITLIIIVLSVFLFKRGGDIFSGLGVFEVNGANFSLEYRKVPFDTKTLEISFSKKLKKESIIEKNIKLSPYIDNKISLIGDNKIALKLGKNMDIGNEYSLTFSKDIESTDGSKLQDDFNVIFEAISGAKVTKIIPEGKLDDISKNIIVLFNIPLIPLQSLEETDKLPCPIEITPAVEGKCKWTGGNVLEFEPTKHFAGATKYEISVKDVKGLLFPLKETKKVIFNTPDLSFNINKDFQTKDGIVVTSNFPVDKNELNAKLKLSEKGGKDLPIKIDNIEKSENRFRILPSNGNFIYSKEYTLAIDKGVKSKYGNTPSAGAINMPLTSSNFLIGVTATRNIYSNTGVLIDTQAINESNTLPIKDIFFELEFDENMTLDKNLFVFKDSTGKVVDFDIKYGKDIEYKMNGEQIVTESKKKIILTLKGKLNYDSAYDLIIQKSANGNIEKDIYTYYRTVKEFKIAGLSFFDNTTLCMNVTNEVPTYFFQASEAIVNGNKNSIVAFPVSKINYIQEDYKDYNTGLYKCPQIPGSKSYIIDIRLEPNKKYDIKIFKSLTDLYGNNLNNDYTYKIQSKNTADKDRYIYSSFNKQVNIIPNNVPLVIDIQSINNNNANIEVCLIDEIGIDEFLRKSNDSNYSPNCIKTYNKSVSLKNRYWTLTDNKFDLEKDIAGEKIDSNSILLRVSTDSNMNGNGQSKFSQIISKSNLSLAYENGKNLDVIFASSLDGSDTPSDLKFEKFIYDEKIGKLRSDGFIKTAFDPNKKAYEANIEYFDMIVAKNDKYYGIINKSTDETSNYDFKYISGIESSRKDFLYLYTERPIYKPGDTVFYKGLLRTFNYNGYTKGTYKKGKIKILNENNEFFKEFDIAIDNNSNFSGKFELPKEMKLGRYTFEMYAENSTEAIYNDTQFFVEEYKKPTFKVNVNSGKKDYMLGDEIKLNIDGEYYFGGKLIDSEYKKSVVTQDYYFNPKEYSDYSFSSGYDGFNCLYWGECNYYDSTVDYSTGSLNSNGNTSAVFSFPKDEKDKDGNANGEKMYSFNFTVTENNTSKEVSNSYNAILHTTDAYVGVKSDYYRSKKDGINLEGIVLNYDANPIKGKQVKIELYKREWKNTKKQGVDGYFYNDYEIKETKEGSFDMTSDSNGKFGDKLMTKGEGEYEVRAIYTGENKKSSISSTFAYIAGDEAYFWNEGNNSVTEMVADKQILKIGDDANLTLKSPVKTGKIFVSIEKDDGILDYFTKDIKSNGERINFKIKDNYYPNIYVKAYLIGSNEGNPLPIYKKALSSIKVTTENKKINVALKPEKNNYLPGDKVNIAIKATIDGKPVKFANGSISLVDESLLALKGNPKKNPYAFFYEMKRYLGVNTYLSLQNLVEKLEVKDIGDGEKGGAGEGAKGGNVKKKRGIFKDTAFWQADFTTDGNGIANITTDNLPDNLTTWVIESVISTSSDNKIGVGEATIVTNKKVMVSDNLPRFFGSSDNIEISPTIFNKTGKNSKFKITITGDNIEISENEITDTINNGSQLSPIFKAKINEIGNNTDKVSKITIKAINLETKDEDEMEKIIPISPTSIIENVATTGKTSTNSFTEKISLKEGFDRTTSLTIRYSPTLLSNITAGIKYLSSYPYGCLEQQLSSLLPNVYIKKLYTSVGIDYDLKNKMTKVWVDNEKGYKEISEGEIITNFIAKVIEFQNPDGGYIYWNDDKYKQQSDANLTTKVIKGLSEIKSIGYTINEKSINEAISFLKKKFYENGNKPNCSYYGADNNMCKYSDAERLEFIDAILSLDKDDYEGYKMYKLIAKDKLLGISGKIYDAKVISKLLENKNINASEKETLKKTAIDGLNKILQENIIYNPRGAFLGKDDVNTRIANTSEFIGAASSIGLDNFADSSSIIDNMVRFITSYKDSSQGSTVDNNIMIKEMTAYLNQDKDIKNINSKVKLNLNTKTIGEQTFDNKNKLEIFEKIIYGNELEKNNDILFSKEGNGSIYYDLNLSYLKSGKNIFARDEGFFVKNEYYDYESYKKIEKLKQDEELKFSKGEIDYDNMKYPKSITNYIDPINEFKKGKLVLAITRIITSEPRDQIAIESFIPSGTELINTKLDIENKSLQIDNPVDREEFRDDRYFGFKYELGAGDTQIKYLLRPTHEGEFFIKPTKAFEFYKTEVFGYDDGKTIKISK